MPSGAGWNKGQFIVNRKATEGPFKHQALMSNSGFVVNDAPRRTGLKFERALSREMLTRSRNKVFKLESQRVS